jgi:hypothetical protein
MKGAAVIASLALLILAVGVPIGGGQRVASAVLTYRYMGNIHGAQAIAQISFEPLRDFTVMAGRIQSGPYVYTFRADIVGRSGYGDMLDHYTQSRFRIRIDLDQSASTFALTSNPFGPGRPTTYYFRRY